LTLKWTRLAADNKMTVNVAFSELRRWPSNAVMQALFVIISAFSSTAAVSGFDKGVASYSNRRLHRRIQAMD
jgi:choline-glycine betaine transporter